jgi:hypothetical protein
LVVIVEMNQEPNNDIDILLRKLSQRDGNALIAAQDGEHFEQKHLDADEFNAYAENALPSALRARYTEHLTECTNCRKIATQLSLASAVVVPSKVEGAKPSSLKTFLAGLFSPSVFRYAIPAMAIVVVVAIAWVAFQRQPRSTDIARVSSESPAPTAANNETSSKSSSNVGSLKGAVSEAREAQVRPGEKAGATPEAAPAVRQEAIQEESKATPVVADDFRDRKDLAKRDQPQPVGRAATVAAAEASAPPPASPKPDVAAERVEAAQKKESEADKNKAMNEPQSRTPMTTSGSRPQKSADAKADPKATASDTSATRRAMREAPRAKDEAEPGEVRTVGGHRFRKRGDVWIDTLYSSQRITNVSRGSEQYRALVADEPGIHSIAQQLKNEFIIVWNGRAYFIK